MYKTYCKCLINQRLVVTSDSSTVSVSLKQHRLWAYKEIADNQILLKRSCVTVVIPVELFNSMFIVID